MAIFDGIKRGIKQLKAAEFQEAGRKIDAARPALSTGDGAPAERFVSPLHGDAPLANDDGKWFAVKVTKVVRNKGERVKYEFVEVGFDWQREYLAGDTRETVAETVEIIGGKVARCPDNPAFNLGGETISVGDICQARRSRRSPYAWEIVKSEKGVVGSGSGSGSGSGPHECCDTFQVYKYRCAPNGDLIETTITYEICIIDGCPVVSEV